MDVSFNEHNLEHVKRKLESGRYSTPDDVLSKALALLNQHNEELARELEDVRAKVQEGVEALENGDYTEYTDETLHELFDDVSKRGREWLSTPRHKYTSSSEHE